MVAVPYVLVTGPKQPFSSLMEMIAYGNQQGSGFSFGTTDVLGMLSVELLKSVSQTKVVQINYKGAPAIVNDVLGGHLDSGATTPPVVKGFSKEKNGLRMLAITSAKRSPSLPDVPTVAELTGIKSFEIATWYGIAGPSGMPASVVDRLEKALIKVMADPTLKTKLIDMGVDVIEDNTSKSMLSTMRSNAEQWGRLADKAGIKP
jgi:tripartite-type tricarboxylate transporter receptor subunit TctC